MIKISSLDFFNKQSFETDVFSKDGTVIFGADDKVTPEILLKLYFKEIFVEQGYEERVEQNYEQEHKHELKKEIEVMVNSSSGLQKAEGSVTAGAGGKTLDGMVAEVELVAKSEDAVAEEALDVEVKAEVKESAAKEAAEPEFEAGAEAEAKAKVEAEAIAVAKIKAEEIVKAEEKAKAEAIVVAKAKAEAEAIAVAKIKAEEIAKAEEKAKAEAIVVAKAKAEAEAIAKAEEEAAAAKAEAEEKAKIEAIAVAKAKAEAKARAEAEEKARAEAEANILKFDVEEAENVARYATQLGKLIGFDDKKIEELNQAAYYHKIGRSRFTKDDLLKKGFLRVQAEESYNILLNEKNFPQRIAGVAKLYSSDYDINSIKLDEDIPYYHIVGIVSYYEYFVRKTGSKDKILRKMLQLGGNKFNIFVLHKFINMMRNLDE